MTELKGPKKILAQYRTVFNSPTGRAVLLDLMKSNHILDSTFIPGDPYMSALREGERNAILKIMLILKLDPENITTIVNEMEDSHV